VSERKQMLGRGAATERIRRGDRRHTLIEWFEWAAAPATIREKYSASTSGSVIPTRNVRPPTRERALRLVEKPRSRTAPRTLSRVAAATSGRPFITRDTVAIDTPAVRATSRIVGRPVLRC
jgi:hypothetical protein